MNKSLIQGLTLTYLLALLGACGQDKTEAQAPDASSVKEVVEPEALTEQHTVAGEAEGADAVFRIYDEQILGILNIEAQLEYLSGGYIWTEGPLWVPKLDCLLFSDIPNNKVHKYCPDSGTSVFLNDSGFSNGLALNHQGELVLMQSRSRRVAVMPAPLTEPKADYTVLASSYDGKRLNSPNDVTIHTNGTLFFTDPPYGLPKGMNDPAKELGFQGVYKLDGEQKLTLLDDSVNYPNGIALSRDEKYLVVAVSDSKAPRWYRYELQDDGQLSSKTLLVNPADFDAEEPRFSKGLPDGLKVHSSGLFFATGPGGIWIFDIDGKVWARILIPDRPVANIALDAGESALYLTAESKLLRVSLPH